MAKVIRVVATENGYDGNTYRKMGEVFALDNETWTKRRPSWVRLADGEEPAKIVAKGPAPGAPEGEKPAGVRLAVPGDWESLPVKERKALALEISGEEAANASDADDVIREAIEQAGSVPSFGDAPPAETVKGNGIQEALGVTQPDWVDPSTGKSAAKPDEAPKPPKVDEAKAAAAKMAPKRIA